METGLEAMETGLEYFSLLSNVCNVLESHVGSGDKVLAEFITDIGRNSEAVDEFESKLKEFGAGDFPDYLVRSLLTTIHAILPSTFKTSNKSSEKAFPDEQPSAFPALSLPDDRRDRARELRLEIEIDAEHKAEDESRKSDRDRDWTRAIRGDKAGGFEELLENLYDDVTREQQRTSTYGTNPFTASNYISPPPNFQMAFIEEPFW